MKRLVLLMVGALTLYLAPALDAAEKSNFTPCPDDAVEAFASELMKEIASVYYDSQKRPSVNVALFDFEDENGHMTVGSRYVSDRIRLAFGSASQFTLSEPKEFEKGHFITSDEFQGNTRLKERVVTDLRAHVYVFGKVKSGDRSLFTCQVRLWGMKSPFTDYNTVDLLELKVPGLTWRPHLTDSGYGLFTRILTKDRWKAEVDSARTHLAEVVFLTQPMCDDLNLSWEMKADGMIYDRRKEGDSGSLRDRTGQVMQSRVKSPETLKELSYVIKSFSLVLKEQGGNAMELETYVIPKKSRYYYLPLKGEEKGLRFEYLWAETGRSTEPAPDEGGTGWRFHSAQADWSVKMPLGIHTATASLRPVAESSYGTKIPKSEYVRRYKFFVGPGVNYYAVNYVYRRDKPEIFVQRLEIGKPEDSHAKSIYEVKEVFKVYGLE